MTNENSKSESAKNLKDCIQENSVPIIFAVVVLMGIFLTKQAPLSIHYE